VKCCRREIGEIVRYLLDEKFRLPLKLLLLRKSRPKSTTASPRQCSHSAPDFILIRSLSAWHRGKLPSADTVFVPPDALSESVSALAASS